MDNNHNSSTLGAREFIDRLWEFLRPDHKDLLTIIGFAFAIGCFSIVLPMGVQVFVSTLAAGTLIQPIILVAFFVLVGSGISGFLRGLQLWTAELLQRRLFLRISLDLAYRLPRIEASELSGMVGADIVYRYLSLTTVQKGVVYLILEGIDVFLKTLIGALVLASYHPILLTYAIVLICAIVFIFFGLSRGAVFASIIEGKSKFQLASWLEEVSRQQLLFRSESGRRFAFAKADDLTLSYLNARKETFGYIFRQASGIFLLQAMVGAVLLGIGGVLIVRQELTIGQLVAAELIVTGIVSTLSKFPKHLETFYDLCAALDKLGSLFDNPLESERGTDLPKLGPLKLTLSKVSFGFGSNKPLIEDLSLDLDPGERISILAPQGSGKSTLVNIIYGLTHPISGSIELNGIDLRSLKIDSIRENIAVIRGSQLIQGTIMSNLCFARDSVSSLAAIEATESLGLREKILLLPNGYETEISFSGHPLSSSQSLLLSISRAIAGSPKLIIIDGALDSLPFELQELVLKVLSKSGTPWSLILFTQDKVLAGKLDKIYLITGGRLA